MTNRKLKNPIISLLFVSIVLNSCNGQNSTNTTNSIPKTEQHPTLVRTQGTQSENVTCQLVDEDGGLWFSIRGEGAYRYDGKSFTNFTTKDGLCSNNVVSIIQCRAGTILLGTGNGICKYDGTQFTTYPVPDTLSITCMMEDKDGNVWFGAKNKGVYRFDGTNLTHFLLTYKHPFFGDQQEKYISDILQDHQGNIWFSSWNGGGVYRYDGNNLKNFVPSSDYYKTNQDKRNLNTPQSFFEQSLSTTYSPSQEYITDDMIFSMTEDHKGNIWFATRDHGICRYDGMTFTTVGRNEGLDIRGVTAILQDDTSSFWITTFDSGVWYYDGATFTQFTESNGLVNNAVMSLLKDKDGHMWFGTKWFGLSRYDGKTFTTFSQHKH